MIARAVLAALRGYKLLLSPLFAGSCRFTPSCADYMREAVHVHGAAAGVWLGVRRLARCRPLGPWGFDPVPPARSPQARATRCESLGCRPPAVDGRLSARGSAKAQ